MARIIDITDKLNFEENPRIKIKDVEIEVCSDAPTILAILQELSGATTTVNNVSKIYEIIFKKEDREKINSLKLNFGDFKKLIECAVDLVVENDKEGE